jgi:hypothetical protein
MWEMTSASGQGEFVCLMAQVERSQGPDARKIFQVAGAQRLESLADTALSQPQRRPNPDISQRGVAATKTSSVERPACAEATAARGA